MKPHNYLKLALIAVWAINSIVLGLSWKWYDLLGTAISILALWFVIKDTYKAYKIQGQLEAGETQNA